LRSCSLKESEVDPGGGSDLKNKQKKIIKSNVAESCEKIFSIGFISIAYLVPGSGIRCYFTPWIQDPE
jgi:hypothetical protein